MSFFGRLFGTKSYQDEPEEKQAEDARFWIEEAGVKPVLPGCDQVPEGTGIFGYSPTNPVPVNGPIGEIVYLNTLLSPEGKPFCYHRLGSRQFTDYPRPLDFYELVTVDGQCWAWLWFDMYFLRRSRMTPQRLRRLPWNELPPPICYTVKSCVLGVNQPVENFPLGLPDAIREHQEPWSEGAALGLERVLHSDPETYCRPPGPQGGIWTPKG